MHHGTPLMFLALAIFAANHVHAAEWVHVGASKIDITPEPPIRLSGYPGREHETNRVEQRLYARALAIGQDVQQPIVLITVELIGISQEITDAVLSGIRAGHGIGTDRFVICATHTHTGPSLRGVLPFMFSADLPEAEEARITRYTKSLVRKLVQVAGAALEDRQPCRLAWAEGTVGFAMQRRVITDGKWSTFGAVPGGWVDHALPVLRVLNERGGTRAILTSYACHCTTLGTRDNFVHPDWAGDAARRLEQAHPGAVGLVALGCGGDANPNPGGGLENVARHGEAVCKEVERVIALPMRSLRGDVSAIRRQLALPLDHEVRVDELNARVAAVQDLSGLDQREAAARKRVAYAASKFLRAHDAGAQFPTSVPLPVVVWRFGEELAMVFLGGEVVSEYSLRLRRELDAARLWVNAYTNSVPCYISSKRMFAEGGYEVEGSMHLYGWPTRLSRGTEDLIVKTVVDLLPSSFRADALEPSPPNVSR